MSSLSDLIARVEKVGAGDRFIDGEIALAVGWEGVNCHGLKWSDTFPSCREKWQDDRGPFDNWKVHPYTSSIDAALTLVPEGMGFNLQGNTNLFYAVVAGQYSKPTTTPALALVAACLKARLALENRNG